MKFIIKLFSGLILFLPIIAKAQHKPQYTQYMQNNYLVNPAIAGIESYIDIKNGYRSQWMGVPGAPKTFYITAHSPIYTGKTSSISKYSMKRDDFTSGSERLSKKSLAREKSHHGVGVALAADKLGSFNRYSGEITYAYHLKLAKQLFMSAGFSFGYTHGSIDKSTIDVGDVNDNALLNSTLQTQNFDLTSGILIYGNYFHFGVSVAQVINKEPLYLSVEDQNASKNNTNYFSTLAFKIPTSDELDIIPTGIVKMIGDSPLSFDASLKAVYRSRYWAGVSYRNSNTYSAFVGLVVLPYLDVSYSYDYGSNELDLASYGSSEIIIGIRLARFKSGKNKSKRKTIPCPAYF